jgi:DNA-binding XRE family transcriptional regulator
LYLLKYAIYEQKSIGNYLLYIIRRGIACEPAIKSTKKAAIDFWGAAMLTGAQIRAARALLRWSGERLAKESGLSWGTIQLAERTDGLPNLMARNLQAIQVALEKGGVEFTNDDEPGVKIKARGRRK